MRFVLILQVALIALIVKINKIECDGNFYTTIENKKYYVNTDEKYNWDESISACSKLNMTLAAIETAEEQEALNILLLNTTIFEKMPSLWIGGRRIAEDDKYMWTSTGKPINFTYWSLINTPLTLECVLMGWNHKMEWSDYHCSLKYGYICEYTQEQEIEIKLEAYEKLKENLKIEVEKREILQQDLNKEKQLSQNLSEQLQQIKFNNVKNQELKEMNEKIIQKQIQLETKLQNIEQNLHEILENKQKCENLQQRDLNKEKELSQIQLETKLQNIEQNLQQILQNQQKDQKQIEENLHENDLKPKNEESNKKFTTQLN